MLPEERHKTRQRKIRTILSVPLSPEQRAELEARAGRQPLSTYARGGLFPANDNDPVAVSRTRGATPVREHAALAGVLARLGQSDAAGSLRALSRLAETGALPVTPENEAAIQKACRDVAEMKTLLMKALGIRER